MLDWIFAAGSGLANSAVGFSIKGAQDSRCRTSHIGVVGCGCAALLMLGALAWLPGPRFVPASWLCGAVMGALFVAGLSLNLPANRRGPSSVAWSVANMGLLIPIGLSWLCGETPVWSDGLMLACFLAMIAAFYRGVARAGDAIAGSRRSYVLLLSAVFLVNGLLMFCFKWNQLRYPDASKAGFLAAAYSCATLLFALPPAKGRRRRTTRAEFGWGAALGISLGLTQLLMQTAMNLPAVIVFPLVQGLSLAGGVLLMTAFFRERLNRYKIAGLLLGIGVIVTSVMR